MSHEEPQRLRASIWFLILPFLSMLSVWPMIAELPPLRIPSNFNWFQVAIACPWYLGVLAAPGYIYAWSGAYSPAIAPPSHWVWVELSLVAAILASAGGFITVLAVIPFPAVLGSFIGSVILFRRFHRARPGSLATSDGPTS